MIPFANITYITSLPYDEVMERLNHAVDFKYKAGWFSSHAKGKVYYGSIRNNVFEMQRIVQGRNSFIPQIKGSAVSIATGTRIKVDMQPHIVVILFGIVWVLGVIAFLFSTLSLSSFDTGFTLIPLGMLVFFFVTSVVAWNYNTGRDRNYLKKLWEADIIEDFH